MRTSTGCAAPFTTRRTAPSQSLRAASMRRCTMAARSFVVAGARSEPATTNDLAAIVQRRIDAARRDWLGAVRRVVKGAAQPVDVRIVDDRRAPAYRVVDYDKTHPYRQKELLAALRARVPGRA